MNCPTCGCPEMVCPVCDSDPTADIVQANIETIKDMHEKGLEKVRLALKAGKPELALEIVDAALAFHPMYGESWPGWPDERKEAQS